MEVNKTTLSIAGVMMATIISRMLGMVREIAIADVYGAGMESDAIVLVWNIPSTLVAFIGSAVGDTYIPYYSMTDAKERMRVSNNLFWMLMIFGGAVSGVLCFFPQIIVKIFAVGFSGARMDLACRLVRFIIWVIVPILLTKLLSAYLQIHQSFAVINIAGVLINLFAIMVIYLSRGKDNIAAYMGIGICFGYYFQLIILCYAAAKKHWFWEKPQKNDSWGIGSYLRMGIPIVFSVGINEMQNIIDKNFVSILAEGIMSNMNYALKIGGIIYSIMFAVATVLFPKLTGLNNAEQRLKLTGMLRKVISYMYILVLPVSVGCIILAQPIVKLLLERGNFTSADTLITASALQLYAIEFMAICISPLLIRIFYALHDMKTPLVCSGIAVLINSTLDFVLIRRWQYKGLIVATLAANICLCIMLFILLQCKYGMKLILKNKIWGMGLIGSLFMGIYVWRIYELAKSYMNNSIRHLSILAGIILSAAILYGTVLGVAYFFSQKMQGRKIVKVKIK